MPKIVDARGRSCPEPVIMTKNAIENYDGEEIQILVDAMVAVENIKRFVTGHGFSVKEEQADGEYSLTITK